MTIKEQNRSNRSAGILIAVMTFIMILIFQITANAQNPNIKKYEKVQYSYSYEKWSKDQPKKRIEAVKYAVKSNSENSKERKSERRLNAKIERIRQRIK